MVTVNVNQRHFWEMLYYYGRKYFLHYMRNISKTFAIFAPVGNDLLLCSAEFYLYNQLITWNERKTKKRKEKKQNKNLKKLKIKLKEGAMGEEAIGNRLGNRYWTKVYKKQFWTFTRRGCCVFCWALRSRHLSTRTQEIFCQVLRKRMVIRAPGWRVSPLPRTMCLCVLKSSAN